MSCFSSWVGLEKEQLEKETNALFYFNGPLQSAFIKECLTFKLTCAQERVLREIADDVTKSVPMNRLLQGDVGSGKTVVAVAAMLASVDAGYQAAMMVPTEVLAKQHYTKIVNC